MDRGEFAASLSKEQEEFIFHRRDGFLKLANTCINEYKDNPSEEIFRRIEDNLLSANTLHFLLNQRPIWEYNKTYEEYHNIADGHQKNMALVHRNKKLEKTLMIKVLAKAGELLEITYGALTLGFGAGVGLFVLNQLCKMLGV